MNKQYLVSKIKNSEFTLFNRQGEMVKDDDRKKPEDGELAVTEMNIFRTGAYKHPFYGLIDFTRDDLEEMIRNFKEGVVTEDIVLNENHMKRKPAAGWLMNMEDALRMRPVEVKKPDGGVNEEMGLFGKIGLNKHGYDFVINHQYKYLSAEIDQDYTLRDINASPKKEDEDGEEKRVELQSFGMALTGVALTNNPFIPNLDKVNFSEGETAEDYKSDFVQCTDDYDSDVRFVVPQNKASEILDSSGKQYSFSKTDNLESEINNYNFEDIQEFRTVEFQDHDFFEDRDKDWDGDEAVQQIRNATDTDEEEITDEYKQGFLWYDFESKDDLTGYKMPVCYADGDELKYVWNGVVAAASSIQGARNKPDVPPDEFNNVKSHIEKIYEKAADVFDDESILPAPWNEDEENQQESNNNNSNEVNLTNQGDTMNFAQLLSDLREFGDEDYDSQIEFLEEKKVESDDKEFSDAIDKMIDEKEEAKRQKEKAEKAIQRQQTFKRQKEQLEEKAQELELKNQELKHKKDEHRLQNFCSRLESKGHHQSVVNKIKQRFSELSQKQRDQKLEFVKEDGEDEQLDVLELMEEVLEELPESARLNEDEELTANKDVEVNPDAGIESDEDSDEKEFNSDLEKVEGMDQFMDEEGKIDWESLDEAK